MPIDTKKHTGLEKGTGDPLTKSDEELREFDGVAGGAKGGVDLAAKTITGIASTINLDRDEEIILPSAFAKWLPKFLSGNSPFNNAHQHRGPKPTQIGWVMEAKIDREKLSCKFRFVEDDDPTSAANHWWKLAKDPKGKGIGFSVGFIPKRWVYGSVADLVKEFPQIRKILADAGYKDEDRLRVYTEVELLEISAVPVGSNRESLQTRSFGFGQDDIAALAKAVAQHWPSQVHAEPLVMKTGETLQPDMTQITDAITAQIKDLIDGVIMQMHERIVAIEEQKYLSSEELNGQTPAVPHGEEAASAAAGGEAKGQQGTSDAAKALLKACEPES